MLSSGGSGLECLPVVMRYYLHIPFCSRHCTYCRFALDPIPSERKIATYIGQLLQEIEDAHSASAPGSLESVYF